MFGKLNLKYAAPIPGGLFDYFLYMLWSNALEVRYLKYCRDLRLSRWRFLSITYQIVWTILVMIKLDFTYSITFTGMKNKRVQITEAAWQNLFSSEWCSVTRALYPDRVKGIYRKRPRVFLLSSCLGHSPLSRQLRQWQWFRPLPSLFIFLLSVEQVTYLLACTCTGGGVVDPQSTHTVTSPEALFRQHDWMTQY